MTENRIPRAPLHLGPSGRKLWRSVVQVYELVEWQLPILESACTASDRLEQARRAIEADGLIVDGGKIGPKANPAVSIERDARTSMLRALRELSLSPDDVAEAPRPPMIAGRYRKTGA